ncbi:MAG: relaxase/mobilization nuclease domain-containing protein [Deltaproteobacteria bacterium]|jgi:hypothetical protein|nr:relaxase/mobilization nuclease domain-containing protein [Deltaproteobacteria bacterium]
MIVKKVKFKSKKPKSKAWQIGDLVDYIRSPRDVNPLEKIEHGGNRNFFAETHAGQKKEMIALATASVHSRMPVSHWIFSWKEHEQPTPEQVDEVVDIFLERMGFTGHQAIYGLHFNTENYHVHIAVNRMSPETGLVVRPNNGFDIEAAHKVMAEIEHCQGWSREDNGRYTMDDSGRIIRAPRPEQGPKPKAEALDYEAHTGDKSAQRIAQERGHAIIQNAASWAELHRKLAAVGLRFEKKGSGAIIFVNEIAVKASSVDRAFSMGKLCKRLGEFEEGAYEDGKVEPIAPEPVSPAHLEDWKEYRTERENAGTVIRQAERQQQTVRAELKTRHTQERKQLAFRLTGKRLPDINHARHELAEKQREERRAMVTPRPVVVSPATRKRPSFKAWLKAHGRNRQADRWRYRNRPFSATPPPSTVAVSREALVAYAAHWEIQQKENKRRATMAAAMALFCKVPAKQPESSSRLDARIALPMRAEGHSREAVTDALRRSAQKLRNEEQRDWQRYAARTAAYAFGLAGDLELARMPQAQRASSVEVKPVANPQPPPQQQHEEEAWREVPRLRMR